MRRFVSLALGASLLICPFSTSPSHAGASTLHVRGLSATDRSLLWTATTIAGRSSRRAVEWATGRPEVAAVARSGNLVWFRFDDGARAAIVPDTPLARSTRANVRIRAALTPTASGLHALVLQPFADQLGYDLADDQAKTQSLQRAGFSVSVLRNSQVTVAALEHMSGDALVYMETHSNPWNAGDAVIMTGEKDVTPYYNLLADGSVIQTTIAGDSSHTTYNAVTSTFFRLHADSFQPNAIAFFNGCGLLQASKLWSSLMGRGLGTMLAWDAEVPGIVADKAGLVFLSELAAKESVADAVQHTRASGFGAFHSGAIDANLGYRGAGGTTVSDLDTQPGPIPTPTPRPAPPLHIALRPAVAPGSSQIVSVQTAPYATVGIRVQYPAGGSTTARRTADTRGSLSYVFRQPPNRVRRGNEIARVQVRASSPGSRAVTLHAAYDILFAPIDIAVVRRDRSSTLSFRIWVHTAPGHRVTISIASSGRLRYERDVRTGREGWAGMTYVPVGQAESGFVVWATTQQNGRLLYTHTDVSPS